MNTVTLGYVVANTSLLKVDKPAHTVTATTIPQKVAVAITPVLFAKPRPLIGRVEAVKTYGTLLTYINDVRGELVKLYKVKPDKKYIKIENALSKLSAPKEIPSLLLLNLRISRMKEELLKILIDLDPENLEILSIPSQPASLITLEFDLLKNQFITAKNNRQWARMHEQIGVMLNLCRNPEVALEMAQFLPTTIHFRALSLEIIVKFYLEENLWDKAKNILKLIPKGFYHCSAQSAFVEYHIGNENYELAFEEAKAIESGHAVLASALGSLIGCENEKLFNEVVTFTLTLTDPVELCQVSKVLYDCGFRKESEAVMKRVPSSGNVVARMITS